MMMTIMKNLINNELIWFCRNNRHFIRQINFNRWSRQKYVTFLFRSTSLRKLKRITRIWATNLFERVMTKSRRWMFIETCLSLMLFIDNSFISRTIVQLISFTFIDLQISDSIDKIVISSISHFSFRSLFMSSHFSRFYFRFLCNLWHRAKRV